MPYEQGIFIDVFPLDAVPENYLLRSIKNFECFCIRKVLWSEVGRFADKSAIKRAWFYLLSKIPDKWVFGYYQNVIKKARDKKIPLILAINKADMVEKEKLLPQIAAFSQEGDFAAIIPISAKHRDGVKELRAEILKHFDEGEPFYDTEIYADTTVRQMCEEIIREKILRLLDREVPHGTAVEIEQMQEGDDITKIKAVIYCEKSSHKPIIIGKKGEAIKRIGSYARADIEKLLDCQVYLELWVKVREDWRNKGTALKELGYTKE